MAAKKTNRKKPHAHVVGREPRTTDDHLRPRGRRTPRPTRPRSRAPGETRELDETAELDETIELDRPPRNIPDVIGQLALSLALLHTVGIALKEFEPQPTLGSVCAAFRHAVDVVGRAHLAAGRFLERRS